MIDYILSNLAPHHCLGCSKTGHILCESCKYDIVDSAESVCLVCHRPTMGNWLCSDCAKHVPYERAWAVAEREDPLKSVIDAYKFQRAREAYKALGDLLIWRLPTLPKDTIIVPIPTTPSRRRRRGYDHMTLVAKYIAKKLRLSYDDILYHQTNNQQRGASAELRAQQAKYAFVAKKEIDPSKVYLLIDDVVTTGATIKYASKCLRSAGAKHVWVAVVARQVLK